MRWLLHKLIRRYYLGITPADFTQMADMSDSQMESYSAQIYQVAQNPAYRNEMISLRYAQEQYIANKASNKDELLFGRACLYVLNMINERMMTVSSYVDTIEETKKQVDKLTAE